MRSRLLEPVLSPCFLWQRLVLAHPAWRIGEQHRFVKELEALVAGGLYHLNSLRYLLAAILYRRADQLLFPYDISQIPNWLLNDYLKFIFDSPIQRCCENFRFAI